MPPIGPKLGFQQPSAGSANPFAPINPVGQRPQVRPQPQQANPQAKFGGSNQPLGNQNLNTAEWAQNLVPIRAGSGVGDKLDITG